jgi:hypothetical protein
MIEMPDKSVEDVLAINAYIRQGWNYCPKKTYKDFYKAEEKPVKTIKEEKTPTKEKKS